MTKAKLVLGLARAFLPEGLVRLSYGGNLPVVDGRRIDPKAQAVSQIAALLRDPARTPTVEESRAALSAMAARFDRPAPAQVKLADLTLPGAEGPRPARSYTPEGWSGGPTLLYLHGGGWVQGGLDTHDGLCGRLAAGSGVRVVSYDYRLAPEDRFPAASEDALAAWLALANGALDCRPERLAVGGDSAGANLTATLMHDIVSGGHPCPCAQLLIYPAVDGTLSSRAMEVLADQPLLSRARIDWYLSHYLPEGQSRTDPRVSPLHSDTHGAQPPALIIAGGHDPLWDDAHAYAAAFEAVGVPVELLTYPGQVHAFLSLTRVLPQGLDAARRASVWLREAFR